jgi:DnaK suppressor protein
MPESHPETAAKQQLLQRRAAIARLRSENDAGAATLGAERRGEELAENDEISGVLVLLSERESAELGEVDAALKRIDLGTWGRCEKCQGPIDPRRLKAFPEARTCTSCAA